MKTDRQQPIMPVGKLKQVNDFLPAPDELMKEAPTIKVTLRLSETSISFFKSYAARYHTKYQKVIRKLLDAYSEKYC